MSPWAEQGSCLILDLLHTQCTSLSKPLNLTLARSLAVCQMLEKGFVSLTRTRRFNYRLCQDALRWKLQCKCKVSLLELSK